MRKIICICLTLLMLSGCASTPSAPGEEGVKFYYRNPDEDAAYFSETGIMAAEERSIQWEQQSISGLMEVYLQGPVSAELDSPFPEGLQLLESEIQSDQITLIFDDSLATLSAIGLRIAAGCIARTLWEYGGYETVIFKTQSQLLDGEESLVMHPAKLVLYDQSVG